MEQQLGHWLFAYVRAQERDFERAVKEAEAAVSLAPYDAFMRGDLGIVLTQAVRPAQAVEWIDAAVVLDPANVGYYNYIKGWALEFRASRRTHLPP